MILHTAIKGEEEVEKQVVVLLHGLFGSGDNLAALARALESDFCVYSMDLRNHGQSPRSEDMNLSAMAADVLETMDALGKTQFHIVGHSLGGKVAMTLALDNSEGVGGRMQQGVQKRVQQVVVADISPVAYGKGRHKNIFKALHSIDLASLQSRSEATALLNSHIDEEGVAGFLLKNLQRSDEGFSWKINLAVIEDQYEELSAAVTTDSSYMGKVLFIKGADSNYILPEHEQPIKALFPNASFRLIEGAGHWLHAQKPVAFNRLVKQFLL